MTKKMKPIPKWRVGIISGFFNPLTYGHIEFFQNVYSRVDCIYVIINNDKQIELKGSIPFQSVDERLTIVKSLKYVTRTIKCIDQDDSVAQTLRKLFNTIMCSEKLWGQTSLGIPLPISFYNSGDRNESNLHPKEKMVCDELGIDHIYLKMSKIQSSSELIQNAVNYSIGRPYFPVG